MTRNEVSRWRRTRLLFVLPIFLVAPLTLAAQGETTGEKLAAGGDASQAKQVAVTKHETKGFEHTLKALSEGVGVLEINDAPMQDLIEHFSKSQHLQFRFESNDIMKRRVTIHVSSEMEPHLTLRDTLLSLCEHFNCTMSILPNGDILVGPTSTDSRRGRGSESSR